MKIPGLDKALEGLDTLNDDMIPLLRSIDNNLRVLAAVMIETSNIDSEHQRRVLLNRLTKEK